MRVLDQGLFALLLASPAVLGSEILFTTVRINTAICTPTGGGGNGTNNNGSGGNSTNLITDQTVSTAYGTYAFKGFYPLSAQGGTLMRVVNKTETTDTMTPGVCGDFCQGSIFFEIQNGDKCSCGSESPTSTPIESADPRTPCAGNKAEVCGSPGYGIVYQRIDMGGGSLTSAQISGPATVIVTGTITDTAGTHTFTSTEVISATTTMTESSGASSLYDNGSSMSGTPSLPTAGPESVQSQTYTTNGSICFGLSCVPESVSSRTGGGSPSTSTSFSVATGSPSASGGSFSSTSASASASPTVGPPNPCPSLNGMEYIDTNGVGYDIACNTNYIGLPSPNDLPSTDARTFAACIADCDNYIPTPNVANGASCVAVTFGIGGTNACYLKFTVTTIQSNNPGYDSAKLHSYNPPGVSSSSASGSTAASSPLGTPSSSIITGGSSSISAGSSSSRGASQSSSPGTLGSSSSTTSSSATLSGSSSNHGVSPSTSLSSSNSVSLSSGGSSSSSALPSSPISSANSVSSSSSSSSSLNAITSSTSASPTSIIASSTDIFGNEPTSITTPVCGAAVNSNNTIYTDIFGYPYYVKCGRNIVGDNAYPAHADTFLKCLEYCDLLVGCAAVTYLDGAASTASNCFPYSSFIGYSSGADGVYSGVPKNGTSDGSIQATPNLCASGPSGYNQSIYSDYFGNNYFIGCDQNVAGSGPSGGQDLKATVADTLLGCLTYCSIYNTCVGVDFTGFPVQQNAANCYPKFATGAITYQPGTQMAYLYI